MRETKVGREVSDELSRAIHMQFIIALTAPEDDG